MIEYVSKAEKYVVFGHFLAFKKAYIVFQLNI